MLWQDSTVVKAVARKLPECSGCRVVMPGAPHPQTVSSGRLFKGSPTGGLAGTASSPPRASAYSSSRLLFFYALQGHVLETRFSIRLDGGILIQASGLTG